MTNFRSLLVSTFFLFVGLPAILGQQDTSTAKKPNKRFVIEVLGNPLSLHLEKRVYTRSKYSLYLGAGVGLPMTLIGEFNLSLTLNNCYRLSRRVSLFNLFQAQVQSPVFPQVPLGSQPNSGYVPGRNYLGVNTLAFGVGVGATLHSGKWEFSPFYPVYNYALGSFAGEHVHITWYSTISLNSRLYYNF